MNYQRVDEVSWKQVFGQFGLSYYWYYREYTEGKSGLDTRNIVAYLTSSAILWSPSIWYKKVVTFKPLWAVTFGYLAGAQAGIILVGWIWGKEEAAEVAELYMGTTDEEDWERYENVAGGPTGSKVQAYSWLAYINIFKAQYAQSRKERKERTTTVTTFTQDQSWQNNINTNPQLYREQLLELGMISVEEYVTEFDRVIAKMDRKKEIAAKWNALTKQGKKDMIAIQAAKQRQINAMSW